MNDKALEAVRVKVTAGGEGISLTVRPSTILVVTGESGSGKSTLAHLLAGVLEPADGVVTIGGTPLSEVATRSERPGFVPQEFALVSTLIAAETVALPLQLDGVSRSTIERRVSDTLAALHLSPCAARLVDHLSGGQRQRVAMARALVTRAPALIMDEPTAELDRDNRELVLDLIREERGRGAAIVVISHDPDLIAVADEAFEMPVVQRHGSAR